MDAYGLKWPDGVDELTVECSMCRRGGYVDSGSVLLGMGYQHHFRRVVSLLIPGFWWNTYSETLLEAWCNHNYIGVAGPASTGKTWVISAFAYATFFIWPEGTGILMSSTSLEGLRMRVWAAMMDVLKRVKKRYPEAPGHVVNYCRRIYAYEPDRAAIEDPRDCIIGIACKDDGGKWKGLGQYAGFKNHRVIGIFDEASMMPRSFWDSASNLSKNPSFKFVAMGNPLSLTDALGVICEPAKEDGGWEGYQEEARTRVWRTRMPGGVAVQLSGLDSPNFRYDKGLNPYPRLITPEAIERDREYYGADSWQYKAMNLGVFPKSESSRRVISRALCESNGAFERPVWSGLTRTWDCVGADISYTPDHGDRSVVVRLRIGDDKDGRRIMAVMDVTVIPVASNKGVTAEQQVAVWVKDYCERNGIPPERFGLDSTGRSSVVSELSKIWSPKIQAIEFGDRPSDRPATADGPRLESELYGKRVSALWFAWRNVISHGQMRGLPEEVFKEGEMRERVIRISGGASAKEDVEPKADTRARMGRSPDLADALVVAIEVARRNGFVISRQSGRNAVRSGHAGVSGRRHNAFRSAMNRLGLVPA